MQLDNKVTGEIIKTNKIKDFRIYYYIYPNKICEEREENYNEGNTTKIDLEFVPTILRKYGAIRREAAYNKILEKETDFVFTEVNSQNWVLRMIGVRDTRVTMDTSFAGSVINGRIDDNLNIIWTRKVKENSELIKAGGEDARFIFQNDSSVCAYFNGIEGTPNPLNPLKPDGVTHYSDMELIAPYIYHETTNPTGQIFVETRDL